MRKSLTMTCAAMLIAIPSLVFAQSGAGGAGVGNADSSAGATPNVHSNANAPAQTGVEPVAPYEGRSSTSTMTPNGKVGDMPSSTESVKGNNSAGAHDSE